jgi:hypothetical protein
MGEEESAMQLSNRPSIATVRNLGHGFVSIDTVNHEDNDPGFAFLNTKPTPHHAMAIVPVGEVTTAPRTRNTVTVFFAVPDRRANKVALVKATTVTIAGHVVRNKEEQLGSWTSPEATAKVWNADGTAATAPRWVNTFKTHKNIFDPTASDRGIKYISVVLPRVVACLPTTWEGIIPEPVDLIERQEWGNPSETIATGRDKHNCPFPVRKTGLEARPGFNPETARIGLLKAEVSPATAADVAALRLPHGQRVDATWISVVAVSSRRAGWVLWGRFDNHPTPANGKEAHCFHFIPASGETRPFSIR